jgi:peptide/nickel transport system substrate-binding protein
MKAAAIVPWGVSALIAACGAPAPAAPAAEQPAAGSGQVAAGAQTAGEVKAVPREHTLIHVGVGGEAPNQFNDVELFNPYLPGITRSGYQFSFEPLFFYNVYGTENNETAWIAESYEFNDDFTQVVIKIRDGVEWSDGTPFTANDVVFTLEMLKANKPELGRSIEVDQWVASAEATDDLTVTITLTGPNPRFVYAFFTNHFDIGLQIVPKHIWEGEDPKTFTNFDMAKGWPVVTGPYKLVLSSPEQKMWDRREDWWAAKTGFHEPPAPERLVFIPGSDESKLVQMMINGEADSTLTLTARNIKAILDQNPNIDTWSGKEPPYGYVDWWPMGLSFNNSAPPLDDPNVRWAINHAIDRDQLIEVAYGGAGVKTTFPWPGFASMEKFEAAIQDILDATPIEAYDPAKTDELMTAAGWAKDGEGYWTKDGQRFTLVVETFNIFQDITPVLVEQLRRAGFDSSFRMTADFFDRLPLGDVQAYTFGHGGGTRDPYDTLKIYHSRFSAPQGERAVYAYRWANTEYDTLVDAMGALDADDPQFMELFHQAMEIWIRELPDIGIAELIHRNPRNNQYWANWPSKENPYINDANWHRTFPLVLMNLKASS